MRTEQLEYLIETAHSSSISRAGEKLHITQQSLNQALKKLEDEIGALLFERNYAGIRLTEEGKIAVRYAEKILADIAELKENIANCTKGETDDDIKGTMTLYASASALHSLIPRAVSLLMQQHEQLNITLIEKDNRDMVRAIMEGAACACITSVIDGMDRDFDLLNRKKIFYMKLTEAKMYISASEAHPIAQQKSVTAHTLLKYPLGFYQVDEQVPQVVDDWLRRKGKPNLRMVTNNLRAYRRAIEAGQIIGFLTKISGREPLEDREGIVYLPVRDFPKIETVCTMDWLYYQENQALVHALLASVSEILKA